MVAITAEKEVMSKLLQFTIVGANQSCRVFSFPQFTVLAFYVWDEQMIADFYNPLRGTQTNPRACTIHHAVDSAVPEFP